MMYPSQDDSLHLWPLKTVELARAGDNEAFTQLFEYNKNGIYGYIRGLASNAEDARDLTQQTFLRAWEKLPTLHEASKFKPWLYRIARNLAYDHLRAEEGRRSRESLERMDSQNTLVSGSDPERETAETQLVILALAEVQVPYRNCLLLQVEGGFLHSEIAGILGIRRTSVSTYLSIARRQFREAYLRLTSLQGIT